MNNKKDEIKYRAIQKTNGKWYPEVKFMGDLRSVPNRKIKRNFASREEADEWIEKAKRAYYLKTKTVANYSNLTPSERLDNLENYLNQLTKEEIKKAEIELGLDTSVTE